MSDYHLTIADKQTGPHSQFYIIQGIREGRFHGTELIWRRGMEGWQPLRELEDFSSYWPPSPETPAKAPAAANEPARPDVDRPRPWLRFWARMVDMIWFSCVLVVVLRILPQPFVQWLAQTIRSQMLLDPLMLLLYAPLEAWLLSRFGTTPGKALLRIQVRTLAGGLPVFRQAMYRSLLVYIRGLALGLPLLSLVAMFWCKFRLQQARVTSWDESSETRVEHGEPGALRYVVLTGIILGIVMTVVVSIVQLWPEIEAAQRNYLSR